MFRAFAGTTDSSRTMRTSGVRRELDGSTNQGARNVEASS